MELILLIFMPSNKPCLRAGLQSNHFTKYLNFPGGSDGKESACKCWRHGYNPGVGKIPGGREKATSVQSSSFSSFAQSRWTLCDPMDCSTPGFPVHQQPLELTQTHVHQVGDAIQPSHPLLSLSPPTFNPSQHQGLFQ